METAAVFKTVWLSLKIGMLATGVNLPLALMLGYFLSRHEFRGKTLLDGLINLPLVMPPVTTGYLLLFLFGRQGLIGRFFHSWFGISIAFTIPAAVIASMVVSFPLLLRSLRISMEMVDPKLETAARTLGAGRREVFCRITLPLILPGLINGVVLGFARSLGEFGATMVFAGNIEGVTRTIPLAVYTRLQIPGCEGEAGILVILSVIISFLAMFLSAATSRRLMKRKHKQYEPVV